MTYSPHSKRLSKIAFFLTGFLIWGFHQNPRSASCGRSFWPCQDMYFLICSSLSPMVEEKYPTLQMPPSRYIVLMNLNFFLRWALDIDLSCWTAAATEISGAISIWIWIWSLSVLIATNWSVGYFFIAWVKMARSSGFTYSFKNFRRYFVPQTIWYWCW